MKKLLLLFLLPIVLQAQNNPLAMFKPLQGGIWAAEGTWGDGSTFKQEIRVTFSLKDKIVKVNSKGFTNEAQTEFGLRNHGIRQYDPATKAVRFWEFDVFGNVTQGIVKQEGKNIIYSYDYGGTQVTEMWQYKDENTYDFIVGIYKEGHWEQKFLETVFRRKK